MDFRAGQGDRIREMSTGIRAQERERFPIKSKRQRSGMSGAGPQTWKSSASNDTSERIAIGALSLRIRL